MENNNIALLIDSLVESASVKLRKARIDSGLSQIEFAKKLGIFLLTVSKYENNNISGMELSTIYRLLLNAPKELDILEILFGQFGKQLFVNKNAEDEALNLM